MRNEFALVMTALVVQVGCATPAEHATSPQQTAYHAETLAAQSTEPPIEQDLDGPHDVSFYVQLALERNPEIIAARYKVAAQDAVIPQATSLQDPMLMDSFWPVNDNSPQTAAGRAPNMVSLSQQFPWMGKLRGRGDVASHQAQIALTELATVQLKTTEGVKLAYYDLWFNQQAITITEASGSLLTDLLKFAEARYRTGGSQQDVFRAQLEIDRLKDQRIRFRRELGVSQADLAKLLHTSKGATPEAKSLGESLSAPDEIDRLYAVAIQCRPELKKQLHAIARDQHAVELACLEYYPNITTSVSWQAVARNDSLSPVSNGNDNIGFGIGINLPIWQDKLGAGVREAEYRMASSTRNYDAARDDTFRMIKRLSVQARAFDEQIKLYRDSILPRAEQTLKVSVADYRVGKVDFQQIIDNWTGLLRFRIQVIRLETSLGQVLASLERVVGCEVSATPNALKTKSPS